MTTDTKSSVEYVRVFLSTDIYFLPDVGERIYLVRKFPAVRFTKLEFDLPIPRRGSAVVPTAGVSSWLVPPLKMSSSSVAKCKVINGSLPGAAAAEQCIYLAGKHVRPGIAQAHGTHEGNFLALLEYTHEGRAANLGHAGIGHRERCIILDQDIDHVAPVAIISFHHFHV
ncbi:hypothetical protein [Paraburkholderia sp. J8-2]|uniref:hypothetical protein n=1 Tax=Paraburkholderia sp. J8-2 TaxID=2805440 RepID=UPI002AB72146|nr:hypothetical protein [Paraburkholderia sp. J8-2]